MVNELTGNIQMPYPGGRTIAGSQNQPHESYRLNEPKGRAVEKRNMDDIVEKDKKTPTVNPEEEKKKTDEILDKERRERLKAKSSKFTREEEEEIRRALEDEREKGRNNLTEKQKSLLEMARAISTGGGASDDYFEHFPAEKFKNPSLKALADNLKSLGQNSQITEEKLQEAVKLVHDMVRASVIQDDEGAEFIEEVSRARTAQATGQPYEPSMETGGAGGQEPPRTGRTAAGGQENRGRNSQEGDGHWSTINVDKFQEDTPIRRIAEQIRQAGFNRASVNQETIRSWANEASAAVQRGEDTEEQERILRDEIQGIMQELQNKESLVNTPKSIQALCRWIIEKEGAQWGPGGVNELIDGENNFKQENFLKWVRERMLFFHGFSPDDELNLLGQIGVETEFRTIGLGTMISNKNQYFRDENRIDPATGRPYIYDEFIEEVVNEVFLFNQSRNYDANYRFTMWSDKDLPGLLSKIHQRSVFTTSDQMKKIFKLSADYTEDEAARDTKVGDSIRMAYEVYYSMSDLEELKEVLGEDSLFFTRKGFEDAYRLSQNKSADEPIPQNYSDLFDSLFDASGKPIPHDRKDENGNNIEGFMSFINLFNETGKLQSTVSLVREAVRLAISERYGLENGLNDSGEARSVRRKNLEYAELWAYSMARWTGAGARNDTGAIGYDAQTKFQRFQEYRLRQARAVRGGAFGNEYDLPVIKDLTLDFFNGIFVEKEVGEARDFTPFEIFKQLDGIDKQIAAVRRNRGDNDLNEAEKGQILQLLQTKEEAYNRFKFKQFTQLDYASNHINRAYQVFEWLTGANEIQIDQIVKHEPFRGLVFDRAKFEEQVKENFIKPIRYAFNTYSNIDYSKKMRVQDRKASREQKRPVYKEVTMAEAMFGPAVLEDFYKKDENGKRVIDEEKLRKDRGLLYKRVIRSILAAHIKSHRERFSGYSKMDWAQMEKFYEALESIREIEIADDEEGLTAKEGFFTEEDIKWMRKASGTGKLRMLLTDVTPSVGVGIAGGFFKGLKDFTEEIFDD